MPLRETSAEAESAAFAALRSEFIAQFGGESAYERMGVGPRVFSGFSGALQPVTLARVYVRPAGSLEETLETAWLYAQEVARWFMARLPRYAAEERFHIGVGWSAGVRAREPWIFKIEGDVGAILALPSCPSHREYEAHTQHAALVGGWAKDVFAP